MKNFLLFLSLFSLFITSGFNSFINKTFAQAPDEKLLYLVEQQVPDGNNWQTNTRQLYSYTSDNKLLEIIDQNLAGGTWVNYKRDLYSYLPARINRITFGQTWIDSSSFFGWRGYEKYHQYNSPFSYNSSECNCNYYLMSDGRISQFVLTGVAFDQSGMVLFHEETISYYYDSLNKLSEIRTVTCIPEYMDDPWIVFFNCDLSSRIFFLNSYDASDNLIEKVQLKDSVHYIDRYLYEYNSNNQLITETYQTGSPGNWINISKTIFNYNSDDLLSEKIIQNWNPGTNEFENQERFLYSYKEREDTEPEVTVSISENTASFFITDNAPAGTGLFGIHFANTENIDSNYNAWTGNFNSGINNISFQVPLLDDSKNGYGEIFVRDGFGNVSRTEFLIEGGTPDVEPTLWTWVNPLPQGRSIIGVHAFDDNSAVIATEAGAVLKTTDGGLNWRTVFKEKNPLTFYSMHFSGNLGWIGSEGVFLKSTDGGENWVRKSVPFSVIQSIFFIDENYGWIAGRGVGYTTNGGNTWTIDTDPFPGQGFSNFFSIFFITKEIGWMTSRHTRGRLLKSTDGGKSWSVKLSNPVNFSLISNHVFFINEQTGFLSEGHYQGQLTEAFKTTDGGKAWIKLNIPVPLNHYITKFEFADDQNGWASLSNGSILKTTDQGITWTGFQTPIKYFLYSVSFSSLNSGWAAGRNGYIIRSSNGGVNWEVQTCGIFDHFFSIHFPDDINGWVVGDHGRIICTTDGGINWKNQESPTKKRLNYVSFADALNGIAVGDSGIIITTTDGGNNWEIISAGISNNLYSVSYPEINFAFISGANGTLYKTTDAGASWQMIEMGKNNFTFFSLFFSSRNIGWLAIGSSIFKTTDGGGTWMETRASLSSNTFRQLFFLDSLTGWGAGHNVIAKTTDGGLTWRLRNSISAQVNSVFFTNKTNGYASTNDGRIFESTDGGENWSLMESLISANVSTIYYSDYHSRSLSSVFFNNENTGWTAGGNGSLLSYNSGSSFGITDVVTEFVSPADYELAQNYPNPFNPSTTIKFALPTSAFVNLSIFNILGEKCADVISEFKEAGYHSISFDASSLSSGAYIYRIKAGDFVDSKKFILLK